MHILFISDNFYPEVNALASRTFDHCKEWVKQGHQVTVVTCVPNFPKGKIYPGYRNKLWQEEVMDGIRVVRVWSYITANEGIFRRILDYISYMFSAIIASIFIRKVDIVIGSSPQFFNACGAYIIHLLKRIPWVFEVRDLWPESIKAVGAMKDGWVISLLEKIESYLYQNASLIVCVTNSFEKYILERGGKRSKIKIVTNGINKLLFYPRKKKVSLVKSLNLEGKFIVGYIGTHGMAHALETLLRSADILHKEGCKDIHFLFIGDGAEKEKLKEYAQKKALSNVTFLDSVSKEDIPSYWSTLDASVTHLRNESLFRTVIPSKLFESIGMGIPVLHGVHGESSDIVKKHQIGVTFDSENPESLVQEIKTLKRLNYLNLKKNCLEASRYFDRVQLAQKMLKQMEKILK